MAHRQTQMTERVQIVNLTLLILPLQHFIVGLLKNKKKKKTTCSIHPLCTYGSEQLQLKQTIWVTQWMTAAENHSGCSVRSAGFLLRCHHFLLITLLFKYEWGVQNITRKQHEVWHTHIYTYAHFILQWTLSFDLPMSLSGDSSSFLMSNAQLGHKGDR